MTLGLLERCDLSLDLLLVLPQPLVVSYSLDEYSISIGNKSNH